MEKKVCTNCHIEKSTNEFYSKNKQKGKIESKCKACSNIKRKKRDQNFRKKNLHKREPKLIPESIKCNCCEITKQTIGNFRKQSNGINFQKICKSCYNQKQKDRLLIDPIYKMRTHIRKMIRDVLKNKGYSKKSKTCTILGIDYDGFKNHIENLFLEGMSWGNHGKWHYDHIIPLASASTYDDLIKLNHYTNLQPLWAEDNLKKGGKIIVHTNTTSLLK